MKGGGGSASRAASRAVWLLLAWTVLAGTAWAATLDDRVYAIARQLMCPVCAGQTVAESDSAVAREMKSIIRQKLEVGETPEQILQYFVGQFGESVLAEPHPGGVALILYWAPPLALVLGVGIAIAFIRRRQASPSEEPAGGGREGD